MDHMRFYCIGSCPLNTAGRKSIDDLISSDDGGMIGYIKNSKLMYCPVGNAPKEPVIIICGKTPGLKTQAKFINLCRNGVSVYTAAFSSIYSNMRDNLFRGLEKIGIFDYLRMSVAFWNADDAKILWDRIFLNEAASDACGIQLTQACDCAILKANNDGTFCSKQPNKATLNQLHRTNQNCLFNSFKITDSLKLIVFLDTPSDDNAFHQINFFKNTTVGLNCAEKCIKVISLPHPSGANPIYNNLEHLTNSNAERLFACGKAAVRELINNYRFTT